MGLISKSYLMGVIVGISNLIGGIIYGLMSKKTC